MGRGIVDITGINFTIGVMFGPIYYGKIWSKFSQIILKRKLRKENRVPT